MAEAEALLIYNTTRYLTEDIESIFRAVVGNQYKPGRVTVSYYSVSKQAKDAYKESRGTGLFVKMLRNGDEHSHFKALKLVRPTRFEGISELEQLAVTAANEAPGEAIRQVMRRIHLMKRWQWSDKGPGWYESCISRAEAEKMDLLIEKQALKLRFNTRDPSSELKAWRLKLVEAKAELYRRRSHLLGTNRDIERTEKALMSNRERLTELNKSKNTHEVDLAGAEMALTALLLESGGRRVL
jgi:hypothetical protein